MYPKVKRVRRGDRTYEYLELVEGHRVGGRVRQHVVANLGRLDELKDSGRLEALVAGLARLDAPPVGTRRDVGPLLIVAHYLHRLGVREIIDAVVPMRGRALATHGEVVSALVANRLASPAPLYDIAGWASSAAVAELLGIPALLLNDDRLGRALEALAPVAEQVRGRVLLATIDRFAVADASRLHLDLTAIRFSGAYPGSELVTKGWAADRTIGRQVKTLQATTNSGVPVYFRPHRGSASELPAFVAALEALRAQLPPGLVVVADSGLGYLANLCAFDTAGTRFVVPLRADTGWADRFDADPGAALDTLQPLDYVSTREQHLPAQARTVWKGQLRPFPVTDDTGAPHDLRVAYIWSGEEAASVAEARERALTKAEAALARVRNGLGGRYYKTRKQVQAKVATILGRNLVDLLHVRTATRAGKPTITWSRDTEAINRAARLDGLYALATNLPDTPDGAPLSALQTLTIYKDQWIVEQRHRDLKQTIKVRPVFLHNDDRIEALVAVVGIALLIFGLIEADLRHALGEGVALPGLLPEHRAAIPTSRAVLAAFTGLHLTYTPTGPVLDPLTTVQRAILAHLDIPLPWQEQQPRPRTP